MVVYISHAVRELHMTKVTAGVHDQGDRLEPLRASKPAGQSRGQKVLAVVLRPHCNGLGEIALQEFSEVLPIIEGFALEYGVEGHRKPRCRSQDPGKPPMNIVAVATQRAMLELQINGIKLPDLAANIENVPVAEFFHAAMRAAQQVLVEIEYSYFENIIKLLFQTAGVRRNPAQMLSLAISASLLRLRRT
jgi:hypothetical protein